VSSRGGAFAGLMRALHWPPESGVVMMWAYFDESGEHDRDSGHLRRLTFGGALASCDGWLGLEPKWRAALDSEGLDTFHMTDFEAWQPPFDFRLPDGTRDYARHNGLLNKLLDAIGQHVPYTFGFTRAVPTRRKFRASYKAGAIDVVMHMATKSFEFHEGLSVLFARHKDFKPQGYDEIFSFMSADYPQLRTVGSDTPACLCQLQVADVIAYEVGRMERDGVPKRYPLKRLKELGCLWRYSGSADDIDL